MGSGSGSGSGRDAPHFPTSMLGRSPGSGPFIPIASSLASAQLLDSSGPLAPIRKSSHGGDEDAEACAAAEARAAAVRRSSMISSFISTVAEAVAVSSGGDESAGGATGDAGRPSHNYEPESAAVTAVAEGRMSPHPLMSSSASMNMLMRTGSTDASRLQFESEENAQPQCQFQLQPTPQSLPLFKCGSSAASESDAIPRGGRSEAGGSLMPLVATKPHSEPLLHVTGGPMGQLIRTEDEFSSYPWSDRTSIDSPLQPILQHGTLQQPSGTHTYLSGTAGGGDMMTTTRPVSSQSLPIKTMSKVAAVPLSWSQLRLSVTGRELADAPESGVGSPGRGGSGGRGNSPRVTADSRHPSRTATGSGGGGGDGGDSFPRLSADGRSSSLSPGAMVAVGGSSGGGGGGGSPRGASAVAKRARQVLQQLYQSPPPVAAAEEGGPLQTPASQGSVGGSMQQQWGKVLAARQHAGGGGGAGGSFVGMGGNPLVSAGRSLGSNYYAPTSGGGSGDAAPQRIPAERSITEANGSGSRIPLLTATSAIGLKQHVEALLRPLGGPQRRMSPVSVPVPVAVTATAVGGADSRTNSEPPFPRPRS